MKIYGDYHTHTVYSHGKGSIRDNVESAIKAGLHDIAITDHGFRHVAYGVRRRYLRKIREEITSLREEYPEIGILMGIEANIDGLGGAVDLKKGDLEIFDIIVAGYHKAVAPNKFSDLFTYHGSSIYEKLFGAPTQKMRARSTDAYLKAIEKYPIDILSHINYGLGVEVGPVAEMCAECGTYLELNGKRVNLTQKEFEDILKTNVKFVVDSDAHTPERVGELSVVERFLEGYDIEDRIANISARPEFRSRREK